jgi:hypothetical protein
MGEDAIDESVSRIPSPVRLTRRVAELIPEPSLRARRIASFRSGAGRSDAILLEGLRTAEKSIAQSAGVSGQSHPGLDGCHAPAAVFPLRTANDGENRDRPHAMPIKARRGARPVPASHPAAPADGGRRLLVTHPLYERPLSPAPTASAIERAASEHPPTGWGIPCGGSLPTAPLPRPKSGRHGDARPQSRPKPCSAPRRRALCAPLIG